MKSGLIYLEQSKVMGNKVGKVDHSHQPLEEYKCQTVEFSLFFKKYLFIYYPSNLSTYLSITLSLYHLSVSKELHGQGHI